jgi:hypothetical protein
MSRIFIKNIVFFVTKRETKEFFLRLIVRRLNQNKFIGNGGMCFERGTKGPEKDDRSKKS